ncbi:MAG TPA: low-specificity L-threonine aldolase [Thermomicrobiales bacterium]|nr:low-specificity L-threonine aldolase [Thermomicrobiales bacterium]
MATIDFRSDTVTLPSPEMLTAIAAAPLGDDVYGEDPTVRALEERAAELLGKEAAVYVTSGTMGNLLATMTHTRPGDEIICGRGAHVYRAEAGGYARISGAAIYTVPQHRAGLDPADIAAGIHPDDPHNPRTALIWVEQPHSGWVMPLDNLAAIRALAREHGLPVHMDGARIFNAAVALGVPAAEIAGYADSVMFCVSKGLAAPVGSLLVGTSEFVARARRNRKVLGGGMRQVGVIAAGGLYALDHTVERLAEDHANARALADGLRALGWTVDREVVETNIIFVQPPAGLAPREVAAALAERAVKVSSPYSGRTMRLVTHYGIDAADIARALDAFRAVTEGVGVAA